MKSTETQVNVGDSPATQIPVGDIDPASWNETRPVTEDLTASMQGPLGQLQDCLLRPNPDKSGRLQMLSGERRWRAAIMIGWANIRGRVLDVGDGEAMDITFAENFHRLAQSPVQQARMLIARSKLDGFDPAALANRIGWTPAVLRRRMNILELIPEWMKRLEDAASLYSKWPIQMWEEIAIYPKAIQESLYDRVDDADWDLTSIRRFFAGETKLLHAAPWSLTDDTLVPAAGSCLSCPHRSGANPELFGEAGGKSAKDDRCLLGSCYSQKMDAHKAQQVDKLRTVHGTVVTIHDSYSPPAGELGHGEYEPAKKGQPGAVPAVRGSGPKEGETTWIKPVEGAGTRKAAKAAGEKAEPTKTLPQKQAALDARRWILVAEAMMKELTSIKRPKSVTLEVVAATVYEFGIDGETNSYDRAKKLAEKPEAVADSLWVSLCDRLITTLRNAIQAKNAETEVLEIAAFAELDATAMFAAAVEKIPTPKSWGDIENKEKGIPAPKVPVKKAKSELAQATEAMGAELAKKGDKAAKGKPKGIVAVVEKVPKKKAAKKAAKK